jgi:uncharacterized protein (DUF1499 family)
MKARRLWRAAFLVLVLTPLSFVILGQFGLLKGSPPTDLGVRDGRLKAPSATNNSVSSQAALWPDAPQREAATIAPLPLLKGDGPATLDALQRLLADWPGAEVVERRPDYLYVRFTTRLMKYVDDAEFWLDPAGQVVQVRSASRLGQEDLGANRNRIEQLRVQLAALRG